MEYSIQELSRLSGVTTRALRWYDKIGLLKPSRVAEERLPLLWRGRGKPSAGHSLLPGPRGGAGPNQSMFGRSFL
ncbi:MAG: MerR family DNA-binding transcriptional regulator [Dysosmobacter sp.]